MPTGLDRSGTRRIFGILAAIAGLAAIVLVAACRPSPEPLRVGLLAWPPYDLAHLAIERDLLDDDRFKLVNFQTPAEIVRSFRYGLIDAMFVTSHFALSTLRDVGDTRIIYIVDVSVGGDALLARPPIDSAEDLEGATVGVEVSPLGMYTLIRALGVLGLERDDIEIVNVDTPDHFRAWQDGNLDALVTYEPTRSLVRMHGAVELFSSAEIPYEILDVLVVRERTIAENRPALVDFVRSFDRALAAYRADPRAAAGVMARRHPLGVDEFLQAMGGVQLFDLEKNVELLTGEDGTIIDALEQQCRVMQKAGMLLTIPDLDPLIDASLVVQAARK